jgi:hypothetical protein
MSSLLALPEGVTATRGAHRALTMMVGLGGMNVEDLIPGRYECRAMGWAFNANRDMGTWSWWLKAPDYGSIGGSQSPGGELWAAYRGRAPGWRVVCAPCDAGDMALSMVPVTAIRVKA